MFLPRNWIPISAIRKIVSTFPGFLGGKSSLRGHSIRYETIKGAWECIDFFMSKTNSLPYFVDAEANPVKPISEVDEYGDYHAELKSEFLPDRESLDNCVHMTPYGGDISVAMNFLGSFWGFKRAHFEHESCFAVFETPEAARRAVRYIEDKTPAKAIIEPFEPEEQPLKELGERSTSIHISIDGKLPNLSKKTGSKRMQAWLQIYDGFEKLITCHGNVCALAKFRDADKAEAAVKDINETTNLWTTFFPPPTPCDQHVPVRSKSPVKRPTVSEYGVGVTKQEEGERNTGPVTRMPTREYGGRATRHEDAVQKMDIVEELEEGEIQEDAPPLPTPLIIPEPEPEPEQKQPEVAVSSPKKEAFTPRAPRRPTEQLPILVLANSTMPLDDLRKIFFSFNGFENLVLHEDNAYIKFTTLEDAKAAGKAYTALARLLHFETIKIERDEDKNVGVFDGLVPFPKPKVEEEDDELMRVKMELTRMKQRIAELEGRGAVGNGV